MQEKKIEDLCEKIQEYRSRNKTISKWPEDIKELCLELLKSGVDAKVLSRRIGISAESLKIWWFASQNQSSAGKLKEIILLDETANQISGEKIERVFTLRTQAGMVLEGLSFEDLKFMKDCGFL